MKRLNPLYCYLIIAVVTFVVYYNSLSNEFVFDDESVIVNNQSIRTTDNLSKFFTAEDGFHKVIGRYYRPVVSASYALDFSIWGLNPYGFHLTNLIIHILSCFLLFKILTLLFLRYKHRNLFSLFATLIFAVHPIHTEAVSWVSGRTDSMVTMFFLASFLFYVEYVKEFVHTKEEHSLQAIESKNQLYLILSLVFYGLGLLTKEMIITMPVIILLFDFVYRKKNLDYFKKNIVGYALFFAVTIIYLILRYELLKDIPERVKYLYFYGQDLTVVIGTMIKTVPVYFRLLIAPFGLLYHYNGVIQDARTMFDVGVVLSILFTAILIYLSIVFYKKDSIVSFCILFFLVTLIPVMNIIPTMNLMAERFLYLTSVCLSLLICHITLLGSAKRDSKIMNVGLIIIIIAFSYLTYTRNAVWKNNDTLYSSAKDVNGTVLLVNYGNIYANASKYDEASALYRKALNIRDNNLLAHHNLGLIYLLRGNLDSAEIRFNKGIAIDSLAPDGYYQLATLYNLQNKKEEAIKNLERLQEIYPNYRESASILENLKSGNTSELTGADIPGNKEAKDFQINILQRRSFKAFSEKRFQDAINDLNELIKIAPDNESKSGYMNNLAMCYAELKDNEMQEKYFIDAIELNPENINAMHGISAFYLKTGKKTEAIEYLKKILSMSPDDENVKKKLDSLNVK